MLAEIESEVDIARNKLIEYDNLERKKEKFEDARFMFERSILFNPPHSNSYLYLAKIYNQEKHQEKHQLELLLFRMNN